MNKIGVIHMVLPGRILMSEEECEKRKTFEHFNLEIRDNKSTETLHVATRTCRPVVKQLTITDVMLKNWLGIDENKNIMNHIGRYKQSAKDVITHQVKELVASMGCSKFTYEIFD